MRITQGTFSFLPDLTDDQILTQVQYCLDNKWAVNIEFTDDPHPRNTYWEMWGLPMFDIQDAKGVLLELNALPQNPWRPLHPSVRVRLDPRLGVAAALLHRQPAQGRGGASGSSASKAIRARSVTPPAPIRSIVPKASAIHERAPSTKPRRRSTSPPSSRNRASPQCCNNSTTS